MRPSDIEVQLIVIAGIQRLIEAADVLNRRPFVDDRRARPDVAILQQLGVMILGYERLLPPADHLPIFPNVPRHPSGKGYARTRLQSLYPHLNSVLEQAIVGVQKDDKGAERLGQAEITCCRDTPIGLAQGADIGITPCHDPGVVGRAIVDNDHLNPGISLPEDAFYGLGKEVGLVEAGDDD
jgi:hypothetical protein